MRKFPKPWFRPNRGVWYVTLNGKQINLGADKDAAFEQYTQLLARPQKRAVPSESLAAITDAFLEWVSKNRSPETYEWYRYRLQRFIECYPDLRVSDLRPFHVETWADGYVFTVTSRRNYLRSVKRCLKWAKKQGYIQSNPIADMEVPAAEAKEAYVSPEEFAVLLRYARNRCFADLLEVTYECGCRPQESLRVTAREVDLTNQRWVFPRSGSKGKKIARVVYLSDKAMQMTQRITLANPEGPIFRNTSGKPWTTEAVNCAFLAVQIRMGKEAMQRSGEEITAEAIAAFTPTLTPTMTVRGMIRRKNAAEMRFEAKRKLTYKRASELAPRYCLYALRHSWATNALKRGLDALTVAILMGHADPSMLSKVYQHLSLNPEHMLDQAKRAAS